MTTNETSIDWMRQIDELIENTPSIIPWYGQPDLMAQIDPFLNSSSPFPHTILFGDPGLGKTHLARYIAGVRGEPFEELLAPVEPEQMPASGIVLLDEVHLQRRPEPLFRQLEADSPTILAASTRPELVEKAFRSRFFLELHFRKYSDAAMLEMVQDETSLSEETQRILATAAAGNPRQAKRLITVSRKLGIDKAEMILSACRISVNGLTDMHFHYLEALGRTSRPTGLAQLATLMYADEVTARSLEPLLIEYDLIELKPNGRVLTRKGRSFLGK